MILTNRWLVLLLVFLVGLSVPMHFQSIAALAPYLVDSSNLNYTDVGVFTGLFMLPGVLLAIPIGVLSARIGDRWALIIGLTTISLAAVGFCYAESYEARLASRLLGGSGSVFLSVLLPKVVTDWFAGREIATAQSIVASSFGLGVGVAMAALPAVAEHSSWMTAMIVNALLTALVAVLLLLFYRDQCVPATTPSSEAPRVWRLTRPETVLVSIAGIGRGLFGTGYVVFMSFLPTLLITRGMTTLEAGSIVGIAAVISIFSVPLGGYLSDRTGLPNWFIVLGALGAGAACALVPYVAPALLWVIVFGVLRGGCTGGILSLPAQVLRPGSRSSGFAVASAIYFVLMAAFPPVGGYLLDATGNSATPILFAAAIWFSIPAMLAVFKFLQARWARTEEILANS